MGVIHYKALLQMGLGRQEISQAKKQATQRPVGFDKSSLSLLAFGLDMAH